MTFARLTLLMPSVFVLACLLVMPKANATGAEGARLDAFDNELRPIIAKYCLRCHGSELQEGDLRIDQLDPDLVNRKDADFWHEVLNQLNEGEMPPEGEPQLSRRELTAMTRLHEQTTRAL